MENHEPYSYWKRPWQKWCILAVGILQFVTLYGNIQDYRDVIHANIFSPEKLAEYVAQQKFSWMITSALGAAFLCIFLIGTFARSRRSADLAELLLLAVFASVLSVGTALLGRSVPNVSLFIAVLVLLWGVVVFTLFRFIKGRHSSQ